MSGAVLDAVRPGGAACAETILAGGLDGVTPGTMLPGAAPGPSVATGAA